MRDRKQPIRDRIWTLMEERGAAAFPGARGRIPNFVGASAAADRLATLDEWRRARVIKCNPDAPQRYVRLRALREGKVVYMALPRLREARCFWELDPRRLRDLRAAASIGGAAKMGRAVDPRDLPHIDLVVAGSVAVARSGARVGKGGGYSDLEFALPRAGLHRRAHSRGDHRASAAGRPRDTAGDGSRLPRGLDRHPGTRLAPAPLAPAARRNHRRASHRRHP